MEQKCIACNAEIILANKVVRRCYVIGLKWYCENCLPLKDAAKRGSSVVQYVPGYTFPAEPGFTIEDSGQRATFDSGSVRDSREGKGRFDLLSPIFLRRLAQHYEAGAIKYDPRNWEKGQPMSRYFDSAMRHMNCYLEGRRTEDHLIAAAWNIAAMVHTEEMVKRGMLPAELCDMPNYMEEKKDGSEMETG
jgi:hypothetical protein